MSQNMKTPSIKDEINNTLSISIPLVSAQMVYSSSWFIGTVMVAKLGENALAASVLVNMIWSSASVFFFGILNGISVLIAHQYGAKNNKSISEIMGQSYVLGVIVCVLILASFFIMSQFLTWTKQPPEVLGLARQYLTSLMWMMPGLIILIIYEQFLAGINRAKMVLRISLLVVPIEIPLIYILVFGKFGLPVCGIAGIGYGFAITYSLTALGMTYMLLHSKQYQIFAVFADLFKIKPTNLFELFKVGIPMGLMNLIEVSTFMFATFWIAQFGTTMLAAHQIIMQYLGFMITLVFGMSQAVTVRVGHAVGENNLVSVRQASYVGAVMNLAIVLVIALAFWTIPNFFLSLDINVSDPKNAALARDAASLLGICGVLLIFDNFRIIGFGALRGLKETKYPMYASLISFWVIGLSAAYLFGFHFHGDGKGVWWGLTFGIACGAVIVQAKLHKMLKTVDLSRIMK